MLWYQCCKLEMKRLESVDFARPPAGVRYVQQCSAGLSKLQLLRVGVGVAAIIQNRPHRFQLAFA